MPNYDYKCSACDFRFTEHQSMSDAAITKCPKCKKNTVQRIIGKNVGIQFVGSGFYVNDNATKASSGNSTS